MSSRDGIRRGACGDSDEPVAEIVPNATLKAIVNGCSASVIENGVGALSTDQINEEWGRADSS